MKALGFVVSDKIFANGAVSKAEGDSRADPAFLQDRAGTMQVEHVATLQLEHRHMEHTIFMSGKSSYQPDCDEFTPGLY